MSHSKGKSPKKGSQKSVADKHTINPHGPDGGHQAVTGDSDTFQQQADANARREPFEGRAQSPQSGNRHQ